MSDGRHLILVGMMGAGKTSVGRRVAKALQRRFVDADAALEKETGRTIPDIFATDGEAGFRAIERGVIGRLADDPNPLVIATGGGAVLSPETRALLRERGTVVWLRATPETLLKRVRGGAGRPLLADDPAGTLTRLCATREEFYADVAHIVVDVDRLTAAQTATEIIAKVGGISEVTA